MSARRRDYAPVERAERAAGLVYNLTGKLQNLEDDREKAELGTQFREHLGAELDALARMRKLGPAARRALAIALKDLSDLAASWMLAFRDEVVVKDGSVVHVQRRNTPTHRRST